MGAKAGAVVFVVILLLYFYGFAEFQGSFPVSPVAGLIFGFVLALIGAIVAARR